MDIWVEQSNPNASALVSLIKAFGFDVPSLAPDLFLQNNGVVRMGNPPLRIEILTSISGVTFNECHSRGESLEIDGVTVSVIGLNDLLINKKASGRLKDLNDIENLSREK